MAEKDWLKKRFIPNPTLAERVYHGEALLLHPERRRFHKLNRLGTKIWEKLSQGWMVSEIIKFIVQKYNISDEEANKDIREFIENLEKENLIIPQK
jgi:hypothetical protein